MTDTAAGSGSDSAHVAAVRSRASERLRRERELLRPLGLALGVAVVVTVAEGSPAPGFRGDRAGVLVALCVFVATLALVAGGRLDARGSAAIVAAIAAMGAAAIALAALQPRGASQLAGGAAVWFAAARLAGVAGLVLGGAITIGLVSAIAVSGASAAALVATALLCVLLGVVATFLRDARASQRRTEVLLAQLEDAREEQLRAAALEERSRIASELHDVLAHALSGAAIQLQGARVLAERQAAGDEVQRAVGRAADLVKDGLASAREAVGALRGEALPGVAQLPSLVESFRSDLELNVSLAVEGTARTLPADAGLALYRGAQEALTNVARYAPGATTSILLRYGPGRTTLRVEDRVTATPAGATGLRDVGGGRGLTGLRDRVERLGGTMSAGATADGWSVELDVPA